MGQAQLAASTSRTSASGAARTVAFLMGCLASGFTGYIGMTLATRGNVRTAAAAKKNPPPAEKPQAPKAGDQVGPSFDQDDSTPPPTNLDD